MIPNRSAFLAVRLCAASLLELSAPGVRAADETVYDRAGAVVGIVLPSSADPSPRYGLSADSLLWMLLPIQGVPVRFLIGENGPWDTKDLEPLRYESEDCTGSALLAASDDQNEPRHAMIFDTMVFWATAAAGDHVVRSVGWPLRDGDACTAEQVSPTFCCRRLQKPETARTAPVEVTDLASLRLSPPFRLAGASR